MAAAAEPGGRPVRRSHSFELLPPDMSQLRIVLLGSTWSQRNSVENFILEHSVSNTEPFSCTRNTSQFRNKNVTVINTPDLLSPTQDKLNEFLKDCAKVSVPGPHVFLLVLHPEDFNEEHKDKLCRILETYNDQSFDRCLILVTPREKSSSLRETHMENPTLKEMIRKCRYRHLKMRDIDRAELLTRLGQVAKENNGEHLTYEVIEETTSPVSSSSAATIRKFNNTDGKEVKLGDLIQIFYDGFQHWAVYVGDGDVVTFFPADSGAGKGVVVKHKLEHVVMKNKWTVNNRLDHKYKPRPANDIVKKACSLVKTEKQWDLYTYNSEHFATDMRYGKAESQQVRNAAAAGVGAGAAAGAAGAMGATGARLGAAAGAVTAAVTAVGAVGAAGAVVAVVAVGAAAGAAAGAAVGAAAAGVSMGITALGRLVFKTQKKK